jgi:hypothetical protein
VRNHKSKQEILDDISKKDFFDEKLYYSYFFMYWYDGEYESSIDYYDHYYDYFNKWLSDPQRLRDEKIDELLDLSKKNRVGDFFPKDLIINKK